ncbi:MAG: bacterial proteasome activator family protein [Acidimicrobiales bacterium]|nr:bacterial proteasome activator family protein [Acidimicrobiales bacterium]MCB9394463.1 bacterial proteasome activator family protein [Acidimicrobiaceae bacterium]
MTDPTTPTPTNATVPGDDVVQHGELVGRVPHDAALVADDAAGEPTETVSEPAKVMRIGSMVKQLLEEVRVAPLDEASRERLAEIYERSIVELSEALSPDLQDELRNLALPFKDGEVPSDAELRIAKAQLVGWLEGLFHGIQATLFAQQLAARQQLEQMRQLPPGATPGGPAPAERPGTYL